MRTGTFQILSIGRHSTAKLTTFAAIEEPIGFANDNDQFIFGARHLHLPIRFQPKPGEQSVRRAAKNGVGERGP
jgi:hypothetical protein